METKQIEELLERLVDYGKTNSLSKREIAERLGIPYNTFRRWFSSGQNRCLPSRDYIERIRRFLDWEGQDSDETFLDAKRRAEKVKYLLLLLADELEWFSTGSKERRDVFRLILDAADVGYLSSLLAMMFDEDKFNRWRVFTSNRFNYFQQRKGEKK